MFEGVIFDVFQWDQKMYDGSTEVFEMLGRPDTAEVIVTKNNKILIQEQEQPCKPKFYSLPGGRIEHGEDPLDGAKREVLEETGYISNDWELLMETNPSSKFLWTIYVYIARGCEWKQKMELDVGEKIELEWVTFDELIDMVDTRKLWNFDQELRVQLIRAKYDLPSKEALKKKIFG